VPARELPPISTQRAAFDERVQKTAAALRTSGIPSQDIRLPNTGTPAEIVDGVVEPGYVVAANVTPYAAQAPAPFGLAYYGENDSSGTISATTLNASSVAGSLTVNGMDALYMDVDTPDMWGIQLNAILGNVTLAGDSGFQFWTQNAVDVYQNNDTINLGEDTWNFSTPSSYIPTGTSTILSHNSNSSDVEGLYVGLGPWIHVTEPFTIAVYLNSSITATGDQELWYNYSLLSGGHFSSGNYDWLIFNSGGPSVHAPIAPFVADGSAIDPVGQTYDYELAFGIGGYNGATMDVLSANLSATLDYCPIAIAVCTPVQEQSVPAAEDVGSQTGETSAGLAMTYTGTTGTAAAGPFILRGLWGFSGLSGSAAGSIPVTNAIQVSGSPDPSGTAPYLFVYFSNTSGLDTQFEWAPDVPVWNLAPGAYQYEVMLADYAEQSGTLLVGPGPTTLSITLPYQPTAGVYTPLWAMSNAQLAGISSSGSGSLVSHYQLFNNPTNSCTNCGGALDNNLSPIFSSWNDYYFPVYEGILLDGTSSYVDIDHSVSFCTYYLSWSDDGTSPSVCFDLQIVLYSADHVTLEHTQVTGGWPGMFETQTVANFVDASQNVFPQADIMIWNSSDDLVMANTFTAAVTIPYFGSSPLYCYGCVSPDELLLYGGHGNTVWGNTFLDPTGPSAGDINAAYAGLAEAESGDLIYNNNFSVDNPTVYLPYDIYTDACPDGYAGQCGPIGPPTYSDEWNVTPQAARAVSATVNGFPLSGNILGSSCSIQGGNYWNDWGNLANPQGVTPFVNVVNYYEIGVLLGGGPTDHASIRTGGDYAPLTHHFCHPSDEARFHAVGLPAGTEWWVNLPGAVQVASVTAWVNVTVSAGPLAFTVGTAANFGVARVTGPSGTTFDSVTLTGRDNVRVVFGALETLNFTESSVAKYQAYLGAPWQVSINGTLAGGPPMQVTSTTTNTVSFTVPAGARLWFNVTPPGPEYLPIPSNGSLTVPVHSSLHVVKFRLLTVVITFHERGLSASGSWTVTVSNGTSPVYSYPISTASGSGLRIQFSLPAGTYNFTITANNGQTPSPTTVTWTDPGPIGGNRTGPSELILFS